MSISHLHGKLKMFLSEDQSNSEAIRVVAEETDRSHREVHETLRHQDESLITKHQPAVTRLL